MIAAITGFWMSRPRMQASWIEFMPGIGGCQSGSSTTISVPISRRSLPADQASSPAPVRMATSTAWSCLNSIQRSISWRRVFSVKELRFSGRLIVR